MKILGNPNLQFVNIKYPRQKNAAWIIVPGKPYKLL